MLERVSERLVAGWIEADLVIVAASTAIFVVAMSLWLARRLRADRGREQSH